MSQNVENQGCCSGASGCCGSGQETMPQSRKLVIDLLYLDLSVCDRCQGTDQSLDDAVFEVAKVLETANIEVTLNKIHITSEEQAIALRFLSSPTIRVNGRDIQLEAHENKCEACGDLCGDDVDCRVWVYQGQEYTIPPKAMIIEAILREAFGGVNSENPIKQAEYKLPENLKNFFSSLQSKDKPE